MYVCVRESFVESQAAPAEAEVNFCVAEIEMKMKMTRK